MAMTSDHMFKIGDRVRRKDGRCDAGMVISVYGDDEDPLMDVREAWPAPDEPFDDVWEEQDMGKWEMMGQPS